MSKPKFSIIVPVYNAADRIRETIQRIEQQEYTNFELIIVNDGSIDDTEKICHSLSDEYGNIVLVSQTNMGPGKARETGVAIATGEYIGFVDSDDYLQCKALERVIRVLCDTNADIIQFGYMRVNDKGVVLSYHPMQEELLDNVRPSYNYFISQKNCTNFFWNKVYKQTLFRDIKWLDLFYSEDYTVLAQLFGKAKRVVVIQDELYYYVQHPESAVNQTFNHRKLDQVTAGKFVIDYTNANFPEFLPEALYYLAARTARLAVDVSYSDLPDKKAIYRDLLYDFNCSYSEMRSVLKKQGRKLCVDRTTRLFALSPNIARVLKKMQ